MSWGCKQGDETRVAKDSRRHVSLAEHPGMHLVASLLAPKQETGFAAHVPFRQRGSRPTRPENGAPGCQYEGLREWTVPSINFVVPQSPELAAVDLFAGGQLCSANTFNLFTIGENNDIYSERLRRILVNS